MVEERVVVSRASLPQLIFAFSLYINVTCDCYHCKKAATV